MSIFNSMYNDDIFVMGILNQSPREPHTVVYHGGPWHGKRESYDPQKKVMLVAEPFPKQSMFCSNPNDTICSAPKIIRYTPKHVMRMWDFKHSRRVVAGQVEVGCTWLGRIVHEPTYETAVERITLADRGIAMVAEDWKGDPMVEEKDCYGREIIHVDRIYQGKDLADF
jgi:hypothetical protein